MQATEIDRVFRPSTWEQGVMSQKSALTPRENRTKHRTDPQVPGPSAILHQLISGIHCFSMHSITPIEPLNHPEDFNGDSQAHPPRTSQHLMMGGPARLRHLGESAETERRPRSTEVGEALLWRLLLTTKRFSSEHGRCCSALVLEWHLGLGFGRCLFPSES